MYVRVIVLPSRPQTLSSLLSGGSLAALARDDMMDLMEKEPAAEGRSLDSGPLLQVLGGGQQDTAGERNLHWPAGVTVVKVSCFMHPVTLIRTLAARFVGR